MSFASGKVVLSAVTGEDDDVCHTSAFRITSSAEGDLSLRLVTRQAEVHHRFITVHLTCRADASGSAKSVNDSGCDGLLFF